MTNDKTISEAVILLLQDYQKRRSSKGCSYQAVRLLEELGVKTQTRDGERVYVAKDGDAAALKAYIDALEGEVRALKLTVESEHDMRMKLQERIDAFERRLAKRGIAVTVRREMGTDINAACGQLRNRHLETQA